MGVIDHVNLPVSDLGRSRRFYDVVTAELGMTLFAKDGPAIGYGMGDWNFGIVETAGDIPALHLAFIAGSREIVEAFHAAALTAGGTDNGAPGLRPEYDAGYFAAFVLDPDGHNIEAVCRE